jgi:glutamate formiminotransferase / formiminotetrahydrofolate cyclodeaminase
MKTIIECVPNFSEGRNQEKVTAIIEALLNGRDVYLLDQEMDRDHNRCVITLVGTRESIGEAALRGIGKAAEVIDLNHHQGAHPRLGATDVVPFIPIKGVVLQDCIRIAEFVAEEAWRRYRIPTYLYEGAARRPERRNLENIRRGQFECVRDEVKTNPDRLPDFGEAALHETAGATVVGARKFLIAYNINLKSPDVTLAKAIAKKIRASSGGFPSVKALGVELRDRHQAQISMNLTDFEATPVEVVFDAVAQEAAAAGVEVEESEIVGLIPRDALTSASVHYLRIGNFHSGLIFENRLERILESRATQEKNGNSTPFGNMIQAFVTEVSAPTATPGGGSVAALSGSLAAALGEMVCALSLKRRSYEAHFPTLEAVQVRLQNLRNHLTENVDRDAQSYTAVLAAFKMPKDDVLQQSARTSAIEEASKGAAETPLQTAQMASEVGRILSALPGITIPQAASDLKVAERMAEAAVRGAIENVRVNLTSVTDTTWLDQMEARLKDLEGAVPEQFQ